MTVLLKMKSVQIFFSVVLLSEVLSIIDKRVINNKNSDKNEGKNTFRVYTDMACKPHIYLEIFFCIIKRQ